jgi:hypothetical protein
MASLHLLGERVWGRDQGPAAPVAQASSPWEPSSPTSNYYSQAKVMASVGQFSAHLLHFSAA